MHILVIGINYRPEETSVGPFTTGVCEHLAAAGHRVSAIVAFPYYPEWRVRSEYRGRWYARESINGVTVRRVRHYVPRRPRGFLERVLHDVTFAFNAGLAACTVRDVDAIYCSTPPPFVPILAWLHARLRGIPFAIKVTDLPSEAALSTGIMKHGWVLRLAQAIESFGYRRARGISVLCMGFQSRLVAQGVADSRIFLVPDWADVGRVRPLPRENDFRRELGYQPSDFVVLHAGNIGLKQKLETVVDAARLAAQRSLPIKWLFIGDGEDRVRLEALSRQYGLPSVTFAGLLPGERVPLALAAANALVLTQRTAVTDSVIPSKLLTYMASGRPVLASVNIASEAALRIQDAACGVVVRPEDAGALLNGVQRLHELGPGADAMGQRGRAYAEAHFSRDAVLQCYDSFFSKVFAKPNGRADAVKEQDG